MSEEERGRLLRLLVLVVVLSLSGMTTLLDGLAAGLGTLAALVFFWLLIEVVT